MRADDDGDDDNCGDDDCGDVNIDAPLHQGGEKRRRRKVQVIQFLIFVRSDTNDKYFFAPFHFIKNLKQVSGEQCGRRSGGKSFFVCSVSPAIHSSGWCLLYIIVIMMNIPHNPPQWARRPSN